MKYSKMKLMWGMLVPLVGFAVALAMIVLPYTPAKTVEAKGGSGCEGDEKIEGSSGTFMAPGFLAIDIVCIKAGKEVFSFQAPDTPGAIYPPFSDCFEITWLHNSTVSPVCVNGVTIGGGGTSRDCKEISHIAVTFKTKCLFCDPAGCL